jgi:hypothetical protein
MSVAVLCDIHESAQIVDFGPIGAIDKAVLAADAGIRPSPFASRNSPVGQQPRGTRGGSIYSS